MARHATPAGPRAPPFQCEGWVVSCQEELTRDRISATHGWFSTHGSNRPLLCLGRMALSPEPFSSFVQFRRGGTCACMRVCVCQCRLCEPIGGNGQQEAGHAHKASGSQLSVTWSRLPNFTRLGQSHRETKSHSGVWNCTSAPHLQPGSWSSYCFSELVKLAPRLPPESVLDINSKLRQGF